ncbi:DnaB-like helicase C-terminal domain-containing protein [Nocardioides campestrisoli]|uniref:DnaB-like helicase C-terminal domain-containing protein n=1 Tax=Nocardioides campestrisoli TaxID=2736757 RepID=UPI0015E7CA11|nr:DnaB-like helicase C-terminal domain-containing protein [Nocardioides campestrisoli]
MDSLNSLHAVLERVDARLLSPASDVRIWATGFPLLDDTLGGGLRAGALNLLAGSQGEGKTTFALQIARHSARRGRPVLFFSYELEAEVLLQKVIAAEAAELGVAGPISVYQVRAAFEDTDGADGGLPERLSRFPGGLDALSTVSEYAPKLMIHRSTTTHTNLEVISSTVKEVIAEHGESPLIVVDYLQKVRPVVEMDEEQAITHVTERLKDIAIEFDCPVLAISASDRAGLEPGSRMRARNMKGSTALAYEADVVLILANKADIVARHHLMYAANNGDHFKEWSVLTVEKNRSGRTGAEIEFKKHFAHGHFLADGEVVSEKLVDERVFTD